MSDTSRGACLRNRFLFSSVCSATLMWAGMTAAQADDVNLIRADRLYFPRNLPQQLRDEDPRGRRRRRGIRRRLGQHIRQQGCDPLSPGWPLAHQSSPPCADDVHRLLARHFRDHRPRHRVAGRHDPGQRDGQEPPGLLDHRGAYEYGFINNEKYELAASAGLHWTNSGRLSQGHRGPGRRRRHRGSRRTSVGRSPLPVIGGRGMWRMGGSNFYLDGQLQYFALSIDNSTGTSSTTAQP